MVPSTCSRLVMMTYVASPAVWSIAVPAGTWRLVVEPSQYRP
jgi:hypothetical protein